MPNKKDKIKVHYGPYLTDEECRRRVDAFLARTKPEDVFPDAYKRFVKHIEMLAVEELKNIGFTPDQHQTQPSPS